MLSSAPTRRAAHLIGALFTALLACAPYALPQPSPKTHLQKQIQSNIQDKLRAEHIEPNPDHTPDVGIDPDADLDLHPDTPAAPLPPTIAPPFGDRLPLAGTWLLHRGALPDGASPTLDDSAWTQVQTSRPLFTYMLFNLNEIWYRRHIRLAPGTHGLAITLADFGGSYRVFANGIELGGHGRMSNHGEYLIARSDTFSIPDSALPTQSQQDLTIAIHAFVGTVDRAEFTLRDGIAPATTVFLGPANLLYRDQQTYFNTGYQESPTFLALWGVLLVLAIALSLLIRGVPLYPILAVIAGGHLLSRLLLDFAEFHYYSHTHWLTWPIYLGLIASALGALELARTIAAVRRRRWFIAVEVVYVLAQCSLILAALGAVSYLVSAVLTRGAEYLWLAVLSLIVIVGLSRRKQDAAIIAGATGLYLFYLALFKALPYLVFDYPVLTHLQHTLLDKVHPGEILNLVVIVAYLTVIIVHTLRIIRERATIATEIEAARTMQQLLLARSSEPTPGFLVESAYLPAGEVGGDFFLIAPTPGGGLFAIIGDVSGKGLRAAMRVSMILGVLRREPSRSPEIVLCSLNEALLTPTGGPADAGFTTACAVQIDAFGHFTIANAGHLSPYLVTFQNGPVQNGAQQFTSRELITPAALPLGLAPDQIYETLTGQLLPTQRLVLLSDGVAEARSPKGELYGFDRVLPLVLRSAHEIATTALRFGQEDDITVLTLARSAMPTHPPPPPPRPAALPPPPRPTPTPPPPPPPLSS